jgi:hypothetical protein
MADSQVAKIPSEKVLGKTGNPGERVRRADKGVRTLDAVI